MRTSPRASRRWWRRGLVGTVLVAAAVLAAAPAGHADPAVGVQLVTTCKDGFNGTLVGVPWTGDPAALTVEGSTSVFVVTHLLVKDAVTDEVHKDYMKPGRREGRTLTSCEFRIPAFGVYGDLTGYFAPTS